ncbi:MAG: MATE family efflux transporter [Treponema sp.]|nr:MATE family efflux transporter [Treponema sp.]
MSAAKVPVQTLDIETESASEKRSIIIGLTWPALAENTFASLVSIIDMVMVASLGAYAIGAVGLISQPRFVMLAAFMALNVGSTAMVSRFKGAGDQESANQVLHQSIIMTLLFTGVLCVIMFFGGNALVAFLAGPNISEEMIQGANVYLRIQVYGFPALALTFTINAVLRGVGNTRAAFYNNGVFNIVKIFLNYCLIGGNLGFPALGLAGASIATVIAQCFALAMAVWKVLSGSEFVRMELAKLLKIDFAIIKRILNIGFPALIEQLIMRIGVMLFTRIITSLGDNPYAAHMIAMNIQQLSFMTGMSFGTAATTLVGQSLGRNRPDLARQYVKLIQRMNYIIAIAVSLLLFFGGEAISGLYSHDQELTIMAANMLKIIALFNVWSSSRFVYLAGLRGAGDARFTAVVTFVGVLFLRPVVSVFLVFPPFPFQLGLAGVWIALSSDAMASYILAKIRFSRGKWETIKV